MKNNNESTEASRQYASAYTVHYETKNLREALGHYRQIMTAYPETKEATYAESQIQNIVNSVVPAQVLFDAKVNLALAHLT